GPGKAVRAGNPQGLLQVHEDDHAREAPGLAPRLEARGDGRARDRRAGARRDRADGRDQLSWPADAVALIEAQRGLAEATPPPWRPPRRELAAAGCFVCFPRGP